MSEIPVISLAEGDPAPAIRQAATEVGFFYIRDHGVPAAAIAAADAAARRFFALPLEVKRTVEINHRHRGFLKVGEAKMHGARRPDLKESFLCGLDLPEDDPDVAAGKPLMGPNIWPAACPELKPALDAYFAEVRACGERLLVAFARALDKPEQFFVERYRKPLARGSVIYYPEQEGEDYGVSPHTDYGCITLLWQDMNGGLEVRSRSGGWIAAPPIEGTFVINIGDLMARWTDNLFASTPHRVVNRSGRARHSMAMFYDPDFDTLIESTKYKPVTCGEYVLSRFAGAFQYRQA